MRTRVLLFGIIVSALSACGGGGSDSPNVAGGNVPAGLYHGTTSNGRAISGIVLEDGEYWLLYSSAGSPTLIAGAEQGHASFAGGSFSSADLKDFNLEGLGISNGSVSGSYTAKSKLAGTASFSASSISFSTTYDTAYDAAPNQAAVVGTFAGTAAVVGGTEPATLTVASNGALSGVSQRGCRFNGTATAHAGTVYTLSVTFQGGVCANGTSTVTGVAYYDPGTRRVYGAALNSARTNGFIFGGGK